MTVTETQVHEFVEKHNLNEESHQLLVDLKPAVQLEIIAQFKPRNDTVDMDGLFQSYLRSRKSGSRSKKNTQPQRQDTSYDSMVTDDMETFIASFDLDESSLKALLHLDTETQGEVMASFTPQDNTKDINKLFQSFCKSRMNRTGAPGLTIPDQAHHTEFFNTYALNEVSQNALLSLPEDIQDEIMLSFQPREDTRDLNNLFLSYVKSRTMTPAPAIKKTLPSKSAAIGAPRKEREKPAPQVVEVPVVMVALTPPMFSNAWCLDEVCSSFFLMLPPSVQTDIMENFQPREPSKDINQLFLSYAKSRAAAHGVPLPRHAAEHAVQSNTSPVRDFIRKWKLSEASVVELDNLSHPVQQKMMADFQPKGNVRDSNKLFLSYMKSRLASTFVSTFNLGEESQELFNSLNEVAQVDIIRSFTPRADTRNVDGLFMHFVTSRLGTGARGTKRRADAGEEGMVKR